MIDANRIVGAKGLACGGRDSDQLRSSPRPREHSIARVAHAGGMNRGVETVAVLGMGRRRAACDSVGAMELQDSRCPSTPGATASLAGERRASNGEWRIRSDNPLVRVGVVENPGGHQWNPQSSLIGRPMQRHTDRPTSPRETETASGRLAGWW